MSKKIYDLDGQTKYKDAWDNDFPNPDTSLEQLPQDFSATGLNTGMLEDANKLMNEKSRAQQNKKLYGSRQALESAGRHEDAANFRNAVPNKITATSNIKTANDTITKINQKLKSVGKLPSGDASIKISRLKDLREHLAKRLGV